MGFWGRLLGRKAAEPSGQNRFWLDLVGSGKTTAGISVTPDSAIKQSAVWACIRVRSEDIGKLPCHLYRRRADGGKERATTHELYALITSRPNPRQTAFEFKAMMQVQLDLRGNALAIKELDGRGRVAALWPVPWDRVTVKASADEHELFYSVRTRAGQHVDFPAEAVVHLRGMTMDGMIGLSPIAYHRETIGLALAAEQYGAAFFGNNAQPSGVLKVKQVLGKEAIATLRTDWETRFQGAENAHKLAVLDGEMDWTQIGMDNADAQYIETRVRSNQDIYRIFRMPPHKVGDLEKATFSNIEQQSLEYVTDCLLAEMVRWEQTLKRDLLKEEEQAEYFFEFMPDALMRGDIKSRYEAFAVARNWGFLSADDIREMENRNPLPDGKGKIYLQPLNMIEAGTPPVPTAGGAKALLAYAQELVAREDAAK